MCCFWNGEKLIPSVAWSGVCCAADPLLSTFLPWINCSLLKKQSGLPVGLLAFTEAPCSPAGACLKAEAQAMIDAVSSHLKH